MKIAFVATQSALAQASLEELTALYGQATPAEADVIVSLGGDGGVLETLYAMMEQPKPVYAMRRTESVGFLCNEYSSKDLPNLISHAQKVILHPLRLEVRTIDGRTETGSAINEVSVIRETPHSAKLRVSIDGIERITKYSGDGLLLSTPAGSTAYNHSCGGPIMPLDANTLVMTAISGFRPRRWSHAVLPQAAVVEIETLELDKRPVRIEAGNAIIRQAAHTKIWLDTSIGLNLLFRPDQHLSERILQEQFMP